ncbi:MULTISPECIES: hypothetical protein [Nocardiopsis]|uniref:hypothetical protein n=1 Tax=Nocardiopsis TaxID=2013 RepID=UPI000346AA95|nr:MULTISPECIES: hypothetical protein [Nocardiopsis]PWV52376.1 hypothetical protein BDW27_106296 [Nocardiopsis sp. L17-MgMaSL7]
MPDTPEPSGSHEPEPPRPASHTLSATRPPVTRHSPVDTTVTTVVPPVSPTAEPEAAPTRNCVELRVHGVSGGQAEELLDVEPAMRVGGDRLAGFFRWRREPDTQSVPGVRREIFAWGNLTSGSASRAFWLLLLPFMMLNVAYWMRPGRMDRGQTGVRRAASITYGAGVRLLALSLTVLITLASAGVGMDLVGWQCAGLGESCVQARPWLAFLASSSSPLSAPGWGLVVGAVLPAAVIVVLWRLSRRTAADYEVVTGPVPPDHSEDAPLSHPDFWRNSEIMARLRSAHIAVAVGTVAALLLVPAFLHDLSVRGVAPATDPGAWWLGAVLAVLLGAVAAATVASVLVPGLDPRWNARADRFCRVLRDTMLVLVVAVAVYTVWPRPGWVAEGRLPGSGTMLNTLFATQGALVVMLLAAALVLFAVDRPHERTAMRGLAGPSTAALGTLLGGGFSAALVYQGSLWLSGCGPMNAPEADCLALSPPTAYSWLQLAFAFEAVIVLVVVAVLALRLRGAVRAQLPEVTSLYSRSVRDRRTWDIAKARATGQMTEVLPKVLAALLLPVVPLVGLALYSILTGNLVAGPVDAPLAVAGELQGVAQSALDALVGVGSLIGGASLVALVWIGRSAYRDRPTRQAVGALWDVGTFWPRVAHPLAPPSYAERAVPQLTARVARMAGEGTEVVISGHSQGSVLAAATVWQLPRSCRGRVSLITHGSPLDRLYARYFPAYFGPASFTDLTGRVSAWRNLWRVTDAIAGPVRRRNADAGDTPPGPAGGGAGASLDIVDQADPLPDPRSYDAPPGEARRPEILGHSQYTEDPAYAQALSEVLPPVPSAPREAPPRASTPYGG